MSGEIKIIEKDMMIDFSGNVDPNDLESILLRGHDGAVLVDLPKGVDSPRNKVIVYSAPLRSEGQVGSA